MLQVAVCDDEVWCLDRTVQILRGALGEIPYNIQTFQSADAVLIALEEKCYHPDIAVLDIRMADVDGIALAKEVNRLAPACRVIFLSSYAGYLMDAYEAEHIYYVLKSDEAARLPVALRKALGALSAEKTLTLRRGGSYQRVWLDTVLYLERSLHKMLVHTTDGDLETTQSPQALLAGDAAGRVHPLPPELLGQLPGDRRHGARDLLPERRHARAHQPFVSQECARGVFPAAGRPERADGCAA